MRLPALKRRGAHLRLAVLLEVAVEVQHTRWPRPPLPSPPPTAAARRDCRRTRRLVNPLPSLPPAVTRAGMPSGTAAGGARDGQPLRRPGSGLSLLPGCPSLPFRTRLALKLRQRDLRTDILTMVGCWPSC